MNTKVYLGVDIGAESGRLIAGLFDGHKIELAEVHRFPNNPVRINGSLRWDILRLWHEIQQGLVFAAKRYPGQIQSIGVDTWGVDFAPFNKRDEMLGHPVHYRDHRHDGMMEWALGKVSAQDIYRITGLQFLPFNSLFQLLAFKQAQPELLTQVDRILLIPDVLHWLLCGSRVIEYTNATTTQCVDVHTQNWSDELLARFELPREIFPKIVPPGTKLGTLREDVSHLSGLPRIDVIAPPTHDTASAVVGVPTQSTGEKNWAYISSGTWSLVGLEIDKPIDSPQALELNVTHEGGVDGTYRLLKNVMGLWLVQNCKKHFDHLGKNHSYAELVDQAANAEPFRSLIDPNDQRFLAPEDMTTAIVSYCHETKQPVPETPGQFVRCCLESLAFKYAAVLKELESLSGFDVQTLHIVGGGSQNDLLNQLTATACQVNVLAGPTEATVLGNVLTQARARGDIQDLSALRQVIVNSYSLKEFQPQPSATLAQAQARWLKLISK